MKTMPTTIQEERLRWIQPVLDKEVTILAMSKVCPFSERTLKYWIASYKKHGVEGLQIKSRKPKSNPKETPIRIKERVIELRNETKLCALKLHWKLKDEGVHLHPRTIGKIIKQEGLTRKYKVRRIQYKYVKVPLRPGELVEIDVKYVPDRIDGMRYYQYTAVDVATRWRYIAIYDNQSNMNSIQFLKSVMHRFPYKIRSIKTDNHAIFTNRSVGYPKSIDPVHYRIHPLDVFCKKNTIIHYLIDKGKPAQNGTVERSHRSDQESFYDRITYSSPEELRYKMRLWNMYYNDLYHCSLEGKSPNQVLSEGVQYVCA